MELSFVYDRLYTKASVSRTKLGPVMRLVSLVLTLAGSVWALLITLDAKYKLLRRHRCVTYTLLAGAVVTDLVVLASHSLSAWSLAHTDWLQCCSCVLVNRRRWSGHMAQSNLITFCLQLLPSQNKLAAAFERAVAGRVLTRTAKRLLLEFPVPLPLPLGQPALERLFRQELKASSGFLNSKLQKLRARMSWIRCNKQIEDVPVREELKAFIFEEVREKEKSFNDWEERQRSRQPAAAGNTMDSNNPFTSYRGDQVLRNEAVAGLDWSLQAKEFDDSLLIWHIATDLRFRQDDQADHDQADTTCRKHMDMARELSNYLFYIMVVHPLMLSPSTTMAAKRCRDTCAEARRHFLKEHAHHLWRPTTEAAARVTQENAHRLLLKVETPLPAAVVKGDRSKSVLWDGCFLARELARAMPGRDTRWRVVCRVWVEMLCYAAVHCGGYQHAKRLKEGGELITFVCLLMTHLGMGKHYRTEVGDAYAHLSAYTV